ncbi:MAG: D-alanyl-D-alanine carboxypeptidase/D-alanyl-D-alanine-endopeptidase [Planctomycetota bacterium]
MPSAIPACRLRSRHLAIVFIATAMITSVCAGGIREDVETAVRTAGLGGATVGISIVDCDAGRSIVRIRDEDQFIPASNMKLLTTGAALHVLGPNFMFQTRLIRDGDRLVVVGDGDPAFGDPELLALMPSSDDPGAPAMDIEQFINLWVDPILANGSDWIREVVVDDRIFDQTFVPANWPHDQLNRRYCAQVAGFNVHLNVMHYFPRPSSGARPDFAARFPNVDWIAETNKATSRTGPNDRSNVWIAREINTNKFTFYGNVKHTYRAPVPVTIHDAPTFFAQLLADRLGESRDEPIPSRSAIEDDPPSAGMLAAPIVRTPLATVVTRCNRDSQNLYAECLLKRVGHELTGEAGSWTNGAAMVRHVIYEDLLNPALLAGLRVSDGSGLSRDNRVTPALMTAWLLSFHENEELGSIFIDSLAVGGQSGTLHKRFRDDNLHGATVQAKSGYINGVSCLTGYVTGANGHRYAFSILVNDLKPGTVAKAKRFQEKVVSRIGQEIAARQVTLGSD